MWLSVTIVAVILLCMGSCTNTTSIVYGDGGSGSNTVYGSGAQTTEDRHIANPIRSVVASAAIHVIVVQGDVTVVKVSGPADCLPRLQTSLEGDSLVIGLLSGTYTSEITVTITTPNLGGLRLSGAGTADVTGLSGDRCEIALDGASHARVRGTAGLAHVVLSGASGADLTGVAAARWEITCDGASTCGLTGTADDAEVTANGASTIDARGFHPRSAHVHADGASTIHLGHVDQLRQEISGASTITTESP
jgi:hypothetical protein